MMQDYKTPSVGTNLAYAIKKCLNSVERLVMINTNMEKDEKLNDIKYFRSFSSIIGFWMLQGSFQSCYPSRRISRFSICISWTQWNDSTKPCTKTTLTRKRTARLDTLQF